MRNKTLVSAIVIALAATVGSASATDKFSLLEGIEAEALTSQEMGMVVGALLQVRIGVADGAMGPANHCMFTDGCSAPAGKLEAITNVVVPARGGRIPADQNSKTVFSPES